MSLVGTDFCRIVGEGAYLIAKTCGNIGEDVSRKLHAVAGVTGETDDDFVEDFNVCLL